MMGHNVLGWGQRARGHRRNACRDAGERGGAPGARTPKILLLQQGRRVTWPAPSPVGDEGKGEDFPSRQELRCAPRAAGEEGWELQRLRDMGFSSAAGLRAPACCPAAAKELGRSHKNALGRKGKTSLEPNDAGAGGGDTGRAAASHPVGLPPTPARGNEPAPATLAACPPQLPAEKEMVGKGAGGCRPRVAG